jgi:DNA-binding NarL/FixJ family response regulator
VRIRILIADDHAVVRDGLQALLAKSPDFEIIGTAASGREAVEGALRDNPDVVVMDIGMPELGGIEAARLLRERGLGCRIVILSMHLSAEHVFRALRAGALGYVAKESAGEEVAEAIRAVAAGRRYLSQQISEFMMEDFLRDGVEVSPLDRLSLRESEVLKLVVDGHTNADIAERIALSPKTVETYRARIMRKLGVKDTVELVKYAMRHGITS